MKSQATIEKISLLQGGKIELILELASSEDIGGDVERLMELKEKGQLEMELAVKRKSRSLRANSYFHVLCSEMARVQRTSMDEMKCKMVLEYGTPAVDPEGKKIFVRIPKSVNINNFYPYAKLIGETTNTKQVCCDYMLFKQTHELNSKEMSDLIEGVVAEAKEMGIQTITKEEMADMLSLEETENGK